MRSIVLSGFMAVGKSTVGRALAARLDLPFVDTDDLIVERTGQSIPGLWRMEGEAMFRRIEADLVRDLFADDVRRVIAFGGGTVTTASTRRLAVEKALVITLTATPTTITERVGDVAKRPNLAVGPDPEARAAELLALRADAYAEAHATFATDDVEPEALVDAVRSMIDRDPLLMPLGRRSYALDFVIGAPPRLTDAIAALAPSSLLVVTDAHVQRARGAALEMSLRPLALPMTRVTLAAGEAQKTQASVSTIWDAALGAGVDRETLVVAFGGGVVGDLAGFAAGTLLRGLRVLQVPTTLLAMVDSSVGGKTGFDHPTGKNLVGLFHQPSGVVIDLAHLSTLPARERRAGLAEMVKIALTCDERLLLDLELNASAIAAGDLEALAPLIRRAVHAKIDVVQDDERETTGRRAILNFGHTVGHALETYGRFERWLHGEAVALGTIAELRLGAEHGSTPPALVDRARILLSTLGLPTDAAPQDLAASIPHLMHDKKRVRDTFTLPFVREAGRAEVSAVSRKELEKMLHAQIS